MSAIMTAPKEVIEADEDVFEISDFTVVTDFEGLIASLESILHNVKETSLVSTDDDVVDEESPFLRRKRDEVHFHFKGREFTLNYFYDSRGPPAPADSRTVDLEHVPAVARELAGHERDFCECSSVARQFGVSSYVLIRPLNCTIEENELHTMLSAVEVAGLDVDFELPVFLQFGDRSSDLYFGLCKNRNTSTSFDSARLRKPLIKHKFLNGLQQMFFEKAYAEITNQVDVSMKIDYVHRKPSPTPSIVAELDTAGCTIDGEESLHLPITAQTTELIFYPFGADFDPFSELRLSACWMDVRSTVINESPTYSDAEPLSAPKWFVSVAFHDDAKYALSSMLATLLDCREGPCASCALSSFSSKWTASDPPSAAHALNAIAHNFAVNQLTFRASSSSAAAGNEKSAAASNELVLYAKRCLKECLRLTKENEANRSEPTEQPTAQPGKSEADANNNKFETMRKSATSTLRYVKGAPAYSLTGYLAAAAVAAFLHDSDHELDAMALLWRQFVHHLRNAWESCTPLAGLLTGPNRLLDLSQCLLHQKLQMIDVCIRTKSERHSKWDSQCEQEQHIKKSKTSTADEDDEDSFFDASESFGVDQAARSVSTAEAAAVKPVGRVKPLDESTYLLNYPGERLLYVPITQDFGPMTEDVVEEQTSYLTSLDSESGERTRAQLDILLSDMQAFKAANPGAVLEDFVRWHSPRDFDPAADEGRGVLSDRMCQTDSVWAETWRNAQPIPVVLQSRLFNETKEVETILQNFERLTVAQLIDLLLPVITLDAVRLLIDKCWPCPSLVHDRVLELCRRAKRCSKMWTVDDFIDLRNEIEAIEVLISRFQSIQSLLSPKMFENDSHLHEFIVELLTTDRTGADVLRQRRSNRVKVIDAPRGPLAKSIYDCFRSNVEDPEAKFVMPPPIRKQYVFRMTHPRPSNKSRPVPHRMYVSVTEDPTKSSSSECLDYHISGSFTSDITFK